PDGWADRGVGAGGPRSRCGRSQPHGRYRRHQSSARHHPRRLRPEHPEQSHSRQRQPRKRRHGNRAMVQAGGIDQLSARRFRLGGWHLRESTKHTKKHEKKTKSIFLSFVCFVCFVVKLQACPNPRSPSRTIPSTCCSCSLAWLLSSRHSPTPSSRSWSRKPSTR